MEKVQYRALKYVCSDFNIPYGELRQKAQMKLPHIQGQKTFLIEAYMIYNNIGPTYLHCLLQKRIVSGIQGT